MYTVHYDGAISVVAMTTHLKMGVWLAQDGEEI